MCMFVGGSGVMRGYLYVAKIPRLFVQIYTIVPRTSYTAGRGRGRREVRNVVNRPDRGQDRNNAGDDEEALPLFFQVRAVF